MKQLSQIFLSLALLVPASALADGCSANCTNSVSCNISSSNSSCNQSGCFNSCTTSVCNTSCDNVCGCPTLLIKRPTYDNTVIYYGLDYQHQYDRDEFYSGLQIAFEYQRSFDSPNLARGLFGSSKLNFAGSQVPNRAANALIADNFGLPINFEGSIALKPIISDFNIHFDWFFGFDKWVPGLYLQLDMNYDYQMRELRTDCGCELNYTTSTVLFPAGYMNGTTSINPILDIQTALSLEDTFGDKQNPTRFGRFDFCTRTKSGLAALSVNLGYDFVRCQDYFLGAFFRVVAPTGSSVKPEYVFDPVIGNGKGWEVGAGISSRWEMWNNNDCQKLTAMLDGYVTSVLKHTSLRTFDLASTNTAFARDYTCTTSCSTTTSCNSNLCTDSSCSVCTGSMGCPMTCSTDQASCNDRNAANCLSRYSLLKQYNLVDGVYTYANNLITAADFTTRKVEVRTPVKGDATIRLVYSHGGFDLGIGYNVFGMVREKISSVGAPSSCISTATGTTVYSVKGCQGVGYFNYRLADAEVISAANPLPLVNSSSQSTAYTCGGIDNPTAVTQFGLDLTFDSNNNNGANVPLDTLVSSIPHVITPELSSPLVTLQGNVNELDLCSGSAPRQFTNKGFVSLNYTWLDNCWSPYIGVIGEIEGGSRNTDIAQWGVVLRGGLSY